jgi:hypothetical protein
MEPAGFWPPRVTLSTMVCRSMANESARRTSTLSNGGRVVLKK